MKSKDTYGEVEVFTHNVTWLRKSCGLSKKKMAEIMGIGVGSLNKIEKGDLPPNLSVEVLICIYRHFHIRPADQLSRRLWEEETNS